MLLGTELGTVSDIDGVAFIVGIPPGTYTVQVSFVGYESQDVQGIGIEAGCTRQSSVALTEGKLEDYTICMCERFGDHSADLATLTDLFDEIIPALSASSFGDESVRLGDLPVIRGVAFPFTTRSPRFARRRHQGIGDGFGFRFDGTRLDSPIDGTLLTQLDGGQRIGAAERRP